MNILVALCFGAMISIGILGLGIVFFTKGTLNGLENLNPLKLYKEEL